MADPSVIVHMKPFKQVVRQFLPGDAPFAGSPIRALCLDKTGIWMGGDRGVGHLSKGKLDLTVSVPDDALPVSSVGVHPKLGVVIGTQTGLFRVAKGTAQAIPAPAIGPIASVSGRAKGGLLVAGREGVLEISGAGAMKFMGRPEGRALACAIETPFGKPMVATDYGIWCLTGAHWEKVALQESLGYFLDRSVKAILYDPAGQLWATDGDSVATLTPAFHWHAIRFSDGLPVGGIRVLALGPAGEVWIGTRQGAAKLENGRWAYFASKRWIPSDEVRALAIESDGTAWVGTDEGLSRIGYQEMTLERKTRFFEEVVKTRHWRHGLVASSCLDQPGDLSSWRQEASDNDGCWTSAYLSAECFRYAVTREEEAKKSASEAFKGLCLLESLTPTRGFVARSVIRKGERVVQSGGEWHETSDGEWTWKGDTSSDELAGNFFAYSVFHDLVATPKEKKLVAGLAGRIMDHLISHDFNLTDLDGKHTTWGVYSPNLLNSPGWEAQKGLNSLELLSHLKATYHMTGDEKYQRMYRRLIDEHHYALNTIDQQVPVPKGVPWDQELAFLVYYPLFLYERDPYLRAIYLQSLEKTWKWIEPEHCPFWTFIYGWVTGNPIRAHHCVEWLRDVPMDLVSWTIRNSHRKDLRIHPERDHEGRLIAMDPIRMSERRVSKLDGAPYCLDGGSDGLTEDDGAFFLLCYWAGRYLGFLVEDPS